MSKVLIVSSSPPNRIEYRVVCELSRKLKEQGIKTALISFFGKKKSDLKSLVSNLSLNIKSSCVIIHSPLTLSLPFVVISKLLKKRVIAIVWDVYPWRLRGKSVHKSLGILLIDLVEPILFSLCDNTVVPTADFLQSSSLTNSAVIPFWPRETLYSCDRPSALLDVHSLTTVKIAFAGQVNATRDISAAYERLTSIACFPFELIIFSENKLPKELKKFDNIISHSFVDRASLNNLLCSCDLALISLSPSFDAPAFPSKVFDYLASNLPCLYFGPKMPAYTSLLDFCGVGIDIGARKSLSLQEVVDMRINFDSKKESYLSHVCISSRSIDAFSHLIGLPR